MPNLPQFRTPQRPTRLLLGLIGIGALSWGGLLAQAGELYVFREGGRVVFSNTPSRADARPVKVDNDTPKPSPALPATRFDPYFQLVAQEYGMPPLLIKAVAAVESAFNPRAVSVKGAQGLMQLMPATAAQYGVDDPFDPLQNLRGGTHHLRDLLAEFDGDLSLALAAYNAGSAAVRRYGGIPNYPETQAYVKKVHAKMNRVPRRRGSTPATPARAVGEIRRTRQADGSIVFRN